MLRNQSASDDGKAMRALRAPVWPRRLQTREAREVQNLLRRLSRMPHWRDLYIARLSSMLDSMTEMTLASSDAHVTALVADEKVPETDDVRS
jgi:hypothetical protein